MAPLHSTDDVNGLESEVTGGGGGGDGDGDDSSYESEDSDQSGSEDGYDDDDNDLSAIATLDPLLLVKLDRGSQTIAEMQRVVDHTGKVEINIGNGLTLLHVAAANNRVDLVEFLCSRGHPTEIKTKHGETPLDQAAWLGAQDAAVSLIKHGADVDCQTLLGYTPLHRAAYYDHPALASLLRVTGADLLIKDSNGETAYDVAENEAIKHTLKPVIDKDGKDITNMFTVHNPKHPNYNPAARAALFEAYAEGFAAGVEERAGGEVHEGDEEEAEEWEDCDDDEDAGESGGKVEPQANTTEKGPTAKRQKR